MIGTSIRGLKEKARDNQVKTPIPHRTNCRFPRASILVSFAYE
ncbi:MAG: hypothetical protein ACI9TH_001104 [Kiritimatiellia bacterium]|jgi:hypothetical protein